MLLRITTGIFGIALAAVVIEAGGLLFGIFAAVLSLLAWLEYTHACALKGISCCSVVGALGLMLLWACAYWGNGDEMLAVLTGTTLLILLETVLLYGQVTFPAAMVSIGGVAYIGLPFAHIVMLRFWGSEDTSVIATALGDFELGAALIWIMFIGTWASDTFAYFVGSAVGRHKLCPTISPGKTIEGFIGSLVGTTATVTGLGLFFSLPLPIMAGLGLALSVTATLGDLVESVLKRHTGIKDSGRLIPGHGGVLDRFDSVLFTGPLVYYFAMITGL